MAEELREVDARWLFRLRVGTGRPDGLKVTSVRRAGGGREDDRYTRRAGDVGAVWQYVCHVKAQDVPQEVVRAQLMEPSNRLGLYVRDCPEEFDRMWETAFSAAPTRETATRRIVYALEAAKSNAPREIRNLPVRPGQMNATELREATKGLPGPDGQRIMAQRGVVKNITDALVEMGLASVETPNPRLNLKLFTLLCEPIEAIEKSYEYRCRKVRENHPEAVAITTGWSVDDRGENKEHPGLDERELAEFAASLDGI